MDFDEICRELIARSFGIPSYFFEKFWAVPDTDDPTIYRWDQQPDLHIRWGVSPVGAAIREGFVIIEGTCRDADVPQLSAGEQTREHSHSRSL